LKSKLILLIVSSLLISANIYAGGFQLNEHGAKAMALGGAFTAVANDPSAIYWNGAGLSQLSGTNIMIGTSLISPQSTFRGVAPDITKYRAKNLIFFPTHFFASHAFNKQWSIGLGFTTPFGLGTEWDNNWVGKYLAIKTTLMTFIVTPVVTFTPVKSLSLSVGFVYSFANVEITRKSQITNAELPYPFLAQDVFADLKGDDSFAYGFNAGIMVKPTDYLSIGASYHSEVKYDFKGTATTTGPAQVASELPNGDITAELTTPQNIAVGVAVDVTKQLKVSADYQFIGWKSYNTLDVNFTDPKFDDLKSPRNYKDSYIIRLGAGYQFNEQVTFMGGIYFDKNPVSTAYLNPTLPETDRIGLSLGLEGKIFDNLTVQGSYLFIRGKQITVNDSQEIYSEPSSTFNGTYNSTANILSLGFVLSL
jgi:long-chain fatty acid transport protein